MSERPDKEWLSDGVTSNLPGELVFPLQSRELSERICEEMVRHCFAPPPAPKSPSW